MLLNQSGFEPGILETCLFFFPVNNRLFLKPAESFEKWGKVLMPERGAFLAVLSFNRLSENSNPPQKAAIKAGATNCPFTDTMNLRMLQ